MPGIAQGAGMMPPLQLSFGSSASSDAKGGSAAGGGMGALNEGDWIIQVTGSGDNTAIPSAKSPGNLIIYGLFALGALWIFKHR